MPHPHLTGYRGNTTDDKLKLILSSQQGKPHPSLNAKVTEQAARH